MQTHYRPPLVDLVNRLRQFLRQLSCRGRLRQNWCLNSLGDGYLGPASVEAGTPGNVDRKPALREIKGSGNSVFAGSRRLSIMSVAAGRSQKRGFARTS